MFTVDPKTPVDRLVFKFGSKSKLARAIKIERSAITQYLAKSGEVPTKQWRKIIAAGSEQGITITIEDLVPADILLSLSS